MPEWNGMEDFKNEMEDNLPRQFQTRFCGLYLQKNTYRCRVVINNIVTEVFNFNAYGNICRQIAVLWLFNIAQTVYVLHHCKHIAICSIDVIVDDFNRFGLVFFLFFILRLTICQVLNFVFLHRHENSYLLFHSRFSLILFLVFQLTIILFGVKAWYFYYGKCSLEVWL